MNVVDRNATRGEDSPEMGLSEKDLDDLKHAKSLLEHPGLAAKITNLLGAPIEKGFDLLPARFADTVSQVTKTALEKALDVSLWTIGDRGPKPSADWLHRFMVAASGAGGGAFGMAALPVELPFSTMIMLRSIADIARSEGEQVSSIDSRLACIEVFALGGRSTRDDAVETGYFAVRAVLAKSVSEAAQFIAERGLAQEGAPAIARLIGQIASRFSVNVSQKLAAQAVPIVGAAGGALVNLAFIDHFQDVARGHFIVRRLERAYGKEDVRAAYESI